MARQIKDLHRKEEKTAILRKRYSHLKRGIHHRLGQKLPRDRRKKKAGRPEQARGQNPEEDLYATSRGEDWERNGIYLEERPRGMAQELGELRRRTRPKRGEFDTIALKREKVVADL